jgi:molybdopterin biosynthesis enzyme
MDRFQQSVTQVQDDPVSCVLVLRDWVESFLEHRPGTDQEDLEYVDEIVEMLLGQSVDPQQIVTGTVTRDLTGLAGSHAVTDGGGII